MIQRWKRKVLWYYRWKLTADCASFNCCCTDDSVRVNSPLSDSTAANYQTTPIPAYRVWFTVGFRIQRTQLFVKSTGASGVKVDRNAWERRSQARYFCSLAFPGLKERFFSGNAHSCCPDQKHSGIVLSMGTQIFQWISQPEFGQDNGQTRNTGGPLQNSKKGPQFFTGGPGIFTVPTTLKLLINPWNALPVMSNHQQHGADRVFHTRLWRTSHVYMSEWVGFNVHINTL